MLDRPSPVAKTYFIACLSLLCFSAFGLTLEELRTTKNLTPTTFASYFQDFEFNFRKEVQTPEVFLATRSGDCDDYSTLAAAVLRERGYTPRLIAVRMPGVTHVVCYVEETKSYLDYNCRSYVNRIVSSDRGLNAIAESVAMSYGLRWVSASEFTYGEGLKRLVQTVIEPRYGEKTFASLLR